MRAASPRSDTRSTPGRRPSHGPPAFFNPVVVRRGPSPAEPHLPTHAATQVLPPAHTAPHAPGGPARFPTPGPISADVRFRRPQRTRLRLAGRRPHSRRFPEFASSRQHTVDPAELRHCGPRRLAGRPSRVAVARRSPSALLRPRRYRRNATVASRSSSGTPATPKRPGSSRHVPLHNESTPGSSHTVPLDGRATREGSRHAPPDDRATRVRTVPPDDRFCLSGFSGSTAWLTGNPPARRRRTVTSTAKSG